MEKVLITGGAGFIGAYLTELLFNEKFEIFIVDNLNPKIHGSNKNDSYLYNIVKNKATVYEEDICDSKHLDELIEKCDYIVHLAAETGTGQSMYEISDYVKTNSFGTALLLEKIVKCKNQNIKKIILASSRAVYGEGKYNCEVHDNVFPKTRDITDLKKGDYECKCPNCGGKLVLLPTDENSVIDPKSIYGLTKFNQEQLVAIACESIGIPYTIFRFQNVYGKGQSLKNPYTGIMAIFSGLILENSEINVFEDGLESRDFVHVKDIVEAILADIKSPHNNMTYNLGSTKNTSVIEMIELLKTNFENEVKYKISGAFRVGDIRHNLADVSRAVKYLNYNPQISLEDGITELVAWIKGQQKTNTSLNFVESVQEMKNLNLYFDKNE